jgi:hypothetical protein
LRGVRRRLPTASAAVGLVIALTMAPLLFAGAGRADRADAATPPPEPIQVTITRLTPIAPQPGDTLVVAGTLTNTTLQPISDLLYELKMGSSFVPSRGAFDAWADDQNGDVQSIFLAPGTSATPAAVPTLDAGRSEYFRISVPVDSLGLGSEWQVRELAVSVSSGFTPVGHVRTFLPWAPRGSAATAGLTTPLAWLWPLADRPHRTTASSWLDDDLAAELSPDGRLSMLLHAADAAQTQQPARKHATTVNVPVTWAVDPMLVSDVKAMTTPYKVPARGGQATGTGTANAKTWLTALRSAVTRPIAHLLALPYADPDIVAAIRAGFTSTVGEATVNGRNLLAQPAYLGTSSLAYGWPPGGFADQRTLNELRTMGDTSAVLSDETVPPIADTTYTPSAHTTITTSAGQIDTLLTDSILDEDINTGSNNPAGWRVALQRFLAETLMINRERPGTLRDVVVAPNRRWAPDPTFAQRLIADTGRVPWLKPVSLADVQASDPDTSVIRQQLSYPAQARHNELPASYLNGVRALRAQVSDFAGILPSTGDAQARSFAAAEQETLSTGWRSAQSLAATALHALSKQVGQAMSQVRITTLAGSFVTLTSHGGKVPVTVANDLDIPVNVVVKLTSQRLTLAQNGRESVTLPPNQQTRVDVHADAKTSGVFPVTVQLLTRNRQKYGPPVNLYVRSTVYGTITLVITGAATAALMVAVAIRLTRRALAARRGTAKPAT